MLRRIGNLLMIIALVAVIGGHWAILQSIAWTGMLAENLQTGSVVEAVSNTFDGDHPCELCKHISEGRKSEKKSEPLDLKLKKFEFTGAESGPVFVAPTDFRLQSLLRPFAESHLFSPPVPPPRRLAV